MKSWFVHARLTNPWFIFYIAPSWHAVMGVQIKLKNVRCEGRRGLTKQKTTQQHTLNGILHVLQCDTNIDQ